MATQQYWEGKESLTIAKATIQEIVGNGQDTQRAVVDSTLETRRERTPRRALRYFCREKYGLLRDRAAMVEIAGHDLAVEIVTAETAIGSMTIRTIVRLAAIFDEKSQCDTCGALRGHNMQWCKGCQQPVATNATVKDASIAFLFDKTIKDEDDNATADAQPVAQPQQPVATADAGESLDQLLDQAATVASNATADATARSKKIGK